MKGRDCDQRQRGRPAGHWPVLPTKCLRQHGWRATPSCAIGTTIPTREIGQIFILCMQLADFRNEIDILRLVVPEVRQILKAQRTAGFRSRVCCLRSWWLRQPRFTCILELGCGEGLNWELGGLECGMVLVCRLHSVLTDKTALSALGAIGSLTSRTATTGPTFLTSVILGYNMANSGVPACHSPTENCNC